VSSSSAGPPVAGAGAPPAWIGPRVHGSTLHNQTACATSDRGGSHGTSQFTDSVKHRPVQQVFNGSIAQTVF